jgi:capsular polysaccharide biosynthesis protein
MLGGPRIHTYLRTIYERRKLARDVLLGVLVLWGMFALWAWQYSASAIVRQTPSGSQQDRASAVDAAHSALTDERLAAIIQHLQLYTEVVRTRGESSAIPYMRSRLSLQPAGRNEIDTDLVRITYLSADKSTAIKVANALAQSLTTVVPSASDSLSVDTAATIDRQLEESRLELKQLAADRRSSRHRSSAHQAKDKLSAPAQPTGQSGDQQHFASAVSVPSPQASAIKALQLQIKDADAHLVELRQRYTDQYPDVQDTQEELQELHSKLNHLQAESARSARVALPSGEEQTGADQAPSQKKLPPDGVNPETKHESPRSSTAARAYAFELDRYHVLLRAQRSMQEYQDKGLGTVPPPFVLVQSATHAKVAGFAVNPFYWLISLLVGLFAATLAVLFAHRLKMSPREQLASRNQFEHDELAPQYRTGTR